MRYIWRPTTSRKVPEYYIRQPVVKPQGEARDFKDICCELAQRLGFPLGFNSAEEFLKQSCDLTPAVKGKAGGFKGMKKWGVWYDKKAKPTFYSYKQPISAESLQANGVIFDEATGVYWNWMLAGVNNEGEAQSVGYRHTPGAYRGYVAQKFGDAVYKGFSPDRINKSGYFELFSQILQDKDLSPLPKYVSKSEHKELAPDELILTINPKSAAPLGIEEGDKIKLKTQLGEIEVTAKVTQNVIPGVIAISSHGGRWEGGRYASGKQAPYALENDSPYEEQKWWSEESVHPNWIIDNVSEPISGQQRWMDTVVKVSRV